MSRRPRLEHLSGPLTSRIAVTLARLPALPASPQERERWQRLRPARREWLTSRIETWTGAMQPIEATRLQGKLTKGRGATRARLIVSACEAVMTWWLGNLETVLVSATKSEPPNEKVSGDPPAVRRCMQRVRFCPP